MLPSNVLTEAAALLMRSFADAGLQEVIVSPGSRSTPYLAAAVNEPRLRCHSVIDERAAAFFALGHARATGRPALLLCTSGSAATHYFPAVVEASMAYVPLLLLTADRPSELHDCHAPQTIDQVKLFGDYARAFFDVAPQATEAGLRSLRRVAAQSLFASRSPNPGPVHINARAAKPLEPVAPKTEHEHALAEIARRIGNEPLTVADPPRSVASESSIATAAALCRAARRGLVVCGPAGQDQADAAGAVAALAAANGFPVWADAASQLRFSSAIDGQVDSLDLVWRTPSGRARFLPDLVIQIGAPPVSSAWEAVSGAIPRIVLCEHGWQDPWSSARMMLFGALDANARALSEACGSRESEESPIVLANAHASKAIEQALSPDSLSEAAAAREIVAHAPRDSLLVLGNSLAIRLVDTYCPHASNRLTVLSQRGASGIDGLVAGAAGASLASGRPLTLMLGDVSLLHDVASLSLLNRVRAPLVVVVVNNGGGRIFEQLPIARAGVRREVMDLTLTEHRFDFEKAAGLYDVAFARAATKASLANALSVAYERAAATLVEVVVPPHGAAEVQSRAVGLLEASLAERA